jgi:hypothetical protein
MHSTDTLDDALDARALIRRLKQELRDCRERLAAARERMEKSLDELEQRQGRLPFGDDAEAEAAAPSPPARAAVNGRPRKRAAARVGWSETR